VAGGSYRISRVDLDTWLHERDATAGAVPQRAERDWPRQSDALIASLITGDAHTARQQIDRLIGGGATVAELCDLLFAPVLYRIGELWHLQELSIADEHRASRIIEGLLERASSARPKPGPRVGTAVVATAVGDRHSLAAQMVSAGLQAEGFRVNYLGAELPVAEILAMAQREHADLVALSCCVAEREGISEAVRTLADAGFPVMVGGSGIGRAEALELGATRYGGSIADAQTFARELVRTKPR
jgi:methanogenic corrinoid protein MtbC1